MHIGKEVIHTCEHSWSRLHTMCSVRAELTVTPDSDPEQPSASSLRALHPRSRYRMISSGRAPRWPTSFVGGPERLVPDSSSGPLAPQRSYAS
jgi:hypothetical protein